MKEKLTSRDIQAQETRKRLLRTSMKLIGTEGYRNVTIQRICKECGVSVGAFYQYFDSKRDIVAHLSRQRNENIYQAAQSLDFSKPARQVYLDYVRITMEYVEKQGHLQAKTILTGMMEAPDVGDLNHGLQFRKEIIFRILEYGRATGEFAPSLNDQDFFMLYSATFHGLMALWCYRDGNLDVVADGCRKLGALLPILLAPGSPA